MTDKIVILIDMDCFYVQVEQRLDPSLKGKPCAVVQYKTWRGGGIIAVGYEARALGVTRNMRGDEAKEKCPSIHLCRVPEQRGKANLTRYREAGAEVIAVFSKFCPCVERASVDEAYLDISAEVAQRMKAMGDSPVTAQHIPNTFVEGYSGLEGRCEWLEKVCGDPDTNDSEYKLAVAAAMVEEMRAAVLKETGFTCSAGIAHNKMLAKLACGRNKPNKQTVLPQQSVPALFASLPLQKIRHLGGKLGAFLVDDLGLQNMGDLTRYTEQELQKLCGHKTGTWLYNAGRGIDFEQVSIRELPKSIGCSKNFRGKEILDTKEKVKFWLSELSKEVCERLVKDQELNKRTAKSLTVHLSTSSPHTSSSRACALVTYDPDKMVSDTYALLKQFNTSPGHSPQWVPHVTNLGISASKFAELGENRKISAMFAASRSNQSQLGCSTDKSEELTDNDLDTESVDESMQFSHPSSSEEAPLSSSNVKSIRPSAVKTSENKTKNGGVGVKGKRRSIESFFTRSKLKEENPDHCQKLDTENSASSFTKISEEVSANASSATDSTNSMSYDRTDEVSVADSKSVSALGSPKGFFAKKLKQISKIQPPATLQEAKSNDVKEHTESAVESSDCAGSESISSTSTAQDSVKERCNSATTDKPASHSSSEKSMTQSSYEDCCGQSGSNCVITTLESPLCSTQKFDDQKIHEIDASKHTSIELSNHKENSIEQISQICEKDVGENKKDIAGMNSDDYIECDKCGEFISVWEMPEHSDFHFAMELQKEERMTGAGSSLASTSHAQATVVKRKPSTPLKKNVKDKKKKKLSVDKSVPPLTSFFSKIS